MNLKKKERLFSYLARRIDSMDYPPITLWGRIRRGEVKKAWKKRASQIVKGALDYPGLYIHIPYCQTKCFFCKFRVRVGNAPGILQEYLKCLKNEIAEFSPLLKGVAFKTVYLAGGTPTILSNPQLEELYVLLKKSFNLKNVSQSLIEATPGTLSSKKLMTLRKQGVNRITIGIQSLDKSLMSRINRANQTKEMVLNTFNGARKAGIEIINIDLVAGIPGQTKASFLEDVDFVLKLRPDALHIFAYEEEDLVIFYQMGRRINDSDRKRRDEMIAAADRMIREYAYRSYKGESYLLAPKAANFQLQLRYLANGSLLGLGAEALSYIPGYYSYENSKLEQYLEHRSNGVYPPFLNGYRLDQRETQTNYIINNIRDGLDKAVFRRIYGVDFDKAYSRQLASLKELGRIQESNGRIRIAVRDDTEFKTYSKFFFSPPVIRKLTVKMGV